MSYSNLFHFPFLQLYECRQKAMHPVEKRNPFGIFRLYYLQRAARIFHTIICHHSTEAIGYSGLNFFENAVFSVGTNAHHHSIIGNIFQQQVEIIGIGLQIGINITNKIGLAVIYSGFDGSA